MLIYRVTQIRTRNYGGRPVHEIDLAQIDVAAAVQQTVLLRFPTDVDISSYTLGAEFDVAVRPVGAVAHGHLLETGR